MPTIMVGWILLYRSSITLPEKTVVERGYFIVGLIILLFAIETCCRDIKVENTCLANDFAGLSRMLKEACLLPLGSNDCPRYNIDSFGYKYLTYNIVRSVEGVIGI